MPRLPRTSLSSARRIGGLRLFAQGLMGSQKVSPVEAVRRLLAMQAQELESGLWSVGARTGATRAEIVRALEQGSIVRSWPLRGTLHLTAAEDLPWLLAAFAPRVLDGMASRRAALDLTERALGRARDIAVARLSGGRALTRAQLLAEFAAGGVAVDAQRGYHLLAHHALRGTICLGPPDGKEQTFVLLDEWIKRRPRRLDRDEALGELARRYFEGHGPASIEDLAGWAKLTLADARRGVEIAGRALATLEVDDRRYLLAAGAEDALETGGVRETSALALPGFDELVLGYKDREAILDPGFAARIVPGGNGVFRPTIIIDGRIEGTWRARKTARAVVIETEPFTRLSRSALSSAAERYAHFLGRPVHIA